jgi:hypothetical protein
LVTLVVLVTVQRVSLDLPLELAEQMEAQQSAALSAFYASAGTARRPQAPAGLSAHRPPPLHRQGGEWSPSPQLSARSPRSAAQVWRRPPLPLKRQIVFGVFFMCFVFWCFLLFFWKDKWTDGRAGEGRQADRQGVAVAIRK